MELPQVLMLFPQQPLLSLLLLFFLASILLYFARRTAHLFIDSLSRALHNGLRLASLSLKGVARRLSERNHEVLLAQGMEASEHMLEREFSRVDAAMQRDMAEYPALQRQLSEVMTRIDEDYQRSAEVPPAPPGWTKAVSVVAKIPATEDPMVVEILRGINDSLVKAQDKVIEDYRVATRKRHELLKAVAPQWRKLQQVLDSIGKRIETLLNRSATIDRHMQEYESIRRGTDHAVRTLSSSSVTQFAIAAFVLAIAVGGAVINFNLIARPMQEMVGGGSYLMGFRTSNIAAMVIILVEVAMGLFLMESLRITRLFPTIAALDDKMRRRMIWASFSMLFILASIEAGLAYMRELLSQDDAALVAGLLSGAEMIPAEAGSRWITTAAQMGMGFILPFALTFVAIPLETFIHASRTVLGMFAVGLLNAFSVVLRVFANGAAHGGRALINLYDLVVFAPLWMEHVVLARRAAPRAAPSVAKEEKTQPARSRGHDDEDEASLSEAIVGVNS